jgi:hypothetical protein
MAYAMFTFLNGQVCAHLRNISQWFCKTLTQRPALHESLLVLKELLL